MSGILGSTVLDVAVGVIFIYFLLSVVCSAINEVIATLLKWRARDLEAAIQNLLCDPALAQKVLDHPLITALGNNRQENRVVQTTASTTFAGKPSYIPARTFALALFDTLSAENGQPGRPINIDTLRSQATRMAGLPGVDYSMAASGATQPGFAATRLPPVPAAAAQIPPSGATRPSRGQPLDAAAHAARVRVGRALLALFNSGQAPGQMLVNIDDLKRRLQQAPGADRVQNSINMIQTLDDVKATALLLPESATRTSVVNAVVQAETALSTAQANVETWFNDAMDRLTGVYRRRVQVWLLLIGLIVTGLTGADTFRVVDGLHNSAALQQFVINEAGRITAPAAASPAASLTVRDTLPVAAQAGGPGIQSAELQPTPEPQAPPPTEPTAPPVAQVAATLSQVQGLFGYGDAPATWEWSKPVLLYVLRKIVGLLLTTAAISLGAPFWFQVLQRVANLRGAGPQPAANNK